MILHEISVWGGLILRRTMGSIVWYFIEWYGYLRVGILVPTNESIVFIGLDILSFVVSHEGQVTTIPVMGIH